MPPGALTLGSARQIVGRLVRSEGNFYLFTIFQFPLERIDSLPGGEGALEGRGLCRATLFNILSFN